MQITMGPCARLFATPAPGYFAFWRVLHKMPHLDALLFPATVAVQMQPKIRILMPQIHAQRSLFRDPHPGPTPALLAMLEVGFHSIWIFNYESGWGVFGSNSRLVVVNNRSLGGK